MHTPESIFTLQLPEPGRMLLTWTLQSAKIGGVASISLQQNDLQKQRSEPGWCSNRPCTMLHNSQHCAGPHASPELGHQLYWVNKTSLLSN